MQDWDVIVIGCGTAGSAAARAAARAGARVLAVDGADELGGLCILRGCMPTKTLLETTRRLHAIRDAGRFGIDAGEPGLDLARLQARTRALIARFQRAKLESIEGDGYELARGRARFVGPHAIEIDGARHAARAFVVAVGSRPRAFPLPVPEGARVVDSDAIFDLDEVPARALVLGAGAVGLELGQWFARAGARVTLAARSRPFHRTDGELGAALGRALADELELVVDAELEGLSATADGTVATLRRSNGERLERAVDLVLNATGRVAAVGDLDLGRAGLDPGEPTVRARTLQTSVPHLFAAGDANDLGRVLHAARSEGAVAGENAARVARGEATLAERPEEPRLRVVFTDPVAASVGPTPQQLTERGRSHRVAVKPFDEQGRGIVTGSRHGFLRLVAEPPSGRLLGCQILGPRADDLIHTAGVLLSSGATAADLVRMPWYHPTLAEAFLDAGRELVAALPDP